MRAHNDLIRIKEQMMPVGTIITWAPVAGSGTDLSTAAKVAAYYGFGTWAAYGAGRVTAAVDGSHAAGSTAGSATHTLTVEEMPAHKHEVKYTFVGRTGTHDGWSYSVAASTESTDYSGSEDTMQLVGGGKAHSIMQPTIYVYRWQRVK